MDKPFRVTLQDPLPNVIPPMIRWGEREISTGDTWHGIPGAGRVQIFVHHPDQGHEHGIAIRMPGGAEETVFWPDPQTTAWSAGSVAPRNTLQLCNAYMTRAGTRERVDRWSENAGMVIEPVSDVARIYRCNHASTDPPAFADLTFEVRLLAGG